MPEAFAELAAVSTGSRPLPRHAGHRVHRRARQALDAADPHRQAHRPAALKIAVDMAEEGLIDREEAVARIDPASLDQLLHPTLDPEGRARGDRQGPAGLARARRSGKVVFNADDAEQLAAAGEKVILVRIETSPEDIHGMHAAKGILTARGGMTSHAAVVARGMGKPCVCGAGDLAIDYRAALRVGRGEVARPARSHHARRLDRRGDAGRGADRRARAVGRLRHADGLGRRDPPAAVRANADTPARRRTARQFGAEGIGLCRTEHMFFEADRILAMREMILAATPNGRRARSPSSCRCSARTSWASSEIMDGLPVTIRLLDPPLHEFLPHEPRRRSRRSPGAGVDAPQALRAARRELHEANPMLGHRGCRLGITYPEIYEMQARAIFEAAVEARRRIDAGRCPRS